jgi:hypothetical protein
VKQASASAATEWTPCPTTSCRKIKIKIKSIIIRIRIIIIIIIIIILILILILMILYGCRGIAPDAKVAFNDLGSTATGGIYTPEDLASRYFNYAYAVGARVHSDSWGTNSTSYDYMAAQVDLFSWQNQVSPLYHRLPNTRERHMLYDLLVGRVSFIAVSSCTRLLRASGH